MNPRERACSLPARVCYYCRPLWSAWPVPGTAITRLTHTLSEMPSSLLLPLFHVLFLLSAMKCLSGIGFQHFCLSVDASSQRSFMFSLGGHLFHVCPYVQAVGCMRFKAVPLVPSAAPGSRSSTVSAVSDVLKLPPPAP